MGVVGLIDSMGWGIQYFSGYYGSREKAPFDSSLLTSFRKRLGMDQVNVINERIVSLKARLESQQDDALQQEAKDSTECNNR
jgi:hypothetical protein